MFLMNSTAEAHSKTFFFRINKLEGFMRDLRQQDIEPKINRGV